jgi:galactose mutarotase-like enzyme
VENTAATTANGHAPAAPMPFALGFHPYFYVPDADKARARIPTNATRAYDNVTKTMIDVRAQGPIDLTAKEVDLHLVDHGANSATLQRGDDAIVVTGSPAFGRWVVWTLAGKDFVCLEPWTAAANALNTGEKLLALAPGESTTQTVTIALSTARA